MKLSKETINVLKNFARINQGIYFREGNVIRTISPAKNIMASANIQESFPVEFGIYDLNNFISVLSLHNDDVTFEFDDRHVLISGLNGRSTIKYRFCAPNMIVVPPEKNLQLTDPDVEFTLDSDDFNWIMKTSSLLSSPHVAVKSDGKNLSLVCMNVEDDSAHTNSLVIGETTSSDVFSMVFRSENLKNSLEVVFYEQINPRKDILQKIQ